MAVNIIHYKYWKTTRAMNTTKSDTSLFALSMLLCLYCGEGEKEEKENI